MKLIGDSVQLTEDFVNDTLNEILNLGREFNQLLQDHPDEQERLHRIHRDMSKRAISIREYEQWVLIAYPKLKPFLRQLYRFHAWENMKTVKLKRRKFTRMRRVWDMDKEKKVQIKNYDDAIEIGSFDVCDEAIAKTDEGER